MKYLIFFLFFHIHVMENNPSVAQLMDHWKDKKSLKEFTQATFNEEARRLVEEIDLVLMKIDQHTNTPESDNSNDDIFEESDLLQLRLEELFDQFLIITSQDRRVKNERKCW